MKHMRRFTALVLALVMVFSLTVTSAGAAPAPETVQVDINYNMSVAYNGRFQDMKDTNGNRVYPILNGGTTYLPVRAVSNMLGLDVKWDQATKTVILSDPADGQKVAGKNTGGLFLPKSEPRLESVTVSIDPGVTVTYNGEVQTMKDTNGNTVYPMLNGGTTYLPVRAVGNMLGLVVNWNQSMQTVLLGEPDYDTKYGEYDKEYYSRLVSGEALTLGGYVMSLDEQGASENEIKEALGSLWAKKEAEEKFISGEWAEYPLDEYAEIDATTADDGYIRIKLTKLIGDGVSVSVGNGDEGRSFYVKITEQTLGTWLTVPLPYGSGEYRISVNPLYDETKNDLEKYEKFKCRGLTGNKSVTADIADPDAVFLISNLYIDFENSPNTAAKAKELTRNCTTEAEKITAIYNYVSQAITYDWTLYNSDKALEEAGEYVGINQIRDLNPDHILTSRKGVCEHYAILMAAMLRSVGIPCKYVSGEANFEGTWEGHGWVAVKPKTGTLTISGMGKDYAGYDESSNKPTDPTGWIRLDPTNARIPGKTSNDNNYKTNGYY
ncbi:MAG: hypothetical protein HDT35_03000 [Clostridiales bacterium]|nr:hypothetical protein [Clostridiales bacterium]